jgi:hypothetical protein
MLKTRGKLNRSDYISTAREHIRILAKITDWDVFQRGADVKVMAESQSRECLCGMCALLEAATHISSSSQKHVASSTCGITHNR